MDRVFAGLREQLVLVSPYFVPGDEGVASLRRLRESGIRGEVIVSDNGSDDRSREIALEEARFAGWVYVAAMLAFPAPWKSRLVGLAAGIATATPADAYVSFALKPDASIERVTMAPVSPAIDFSFDYQDLLFTPVPAGADAKAR